MKTRAVTMHGVALLIATFGVAGWGLAGPAHQVGPATGTFTQPTRLGTPGKVRTLYDQNDDFGGVGLDSQNYTSGTDAGYNDQGADDFVVPKGKTWLITEVDVSGQYYGSGPATGETVFFRKDASGIPGKTIGTYVDVKGQDSSGSFAITLPKPMKLRAGTYWVTVQAYCPYDGCGQWLWNVRSVQSGNPATWENPNGEWDFAPRGTRSRTAGSTARTLCST